MSSKRLAKGQLIQQYSAIFQQRAIQDRAFLDFLYPETPKDLRTQWLIGLIQQNLEVALTKIEELHYGVDDKKSIVSVLLERVDQIGYQEKARLYKAINEMKCAGDVNLRSTLASQIKALLKTMDHNFQRVGLEALQEAEYLSASLKREIAREVVEWLRGLDPANAYQPSTIESAPINWDVLEQLVKRDFLDFIFDKLIKRATSVESINVAFKIHKNIKPPYEKYQSYYDDIYEKAEGETNEQLKQEIIEGLKSLIPPRLSKKNREFWNKVAKL